MVKRCFLLFSFLGMIFSCVNRSKEFNSFEFPGISESLEDSHTKGLLLDVYDVFVVVNLDTIEINKGAWLEKKWYPLKGEDFKLDSTKFQLIIPLNKSMYHDELSSSDRVEIYDESWRSCGSMGELYYFTLEEVDSMPNLIVEVNGQRLSSLIFKKDSI